MISAVGTDRPCDHWNGTPSDLMVGAIHLRSTSLGVRANILPVVVRLVLQRYGVLYLPSPDATSRYY
jgi:hypothetical protein